MKIVAGGLEHELCPRVAAEQAEALLPQVAALGFDAQPEYLSDGVSISVATGEGAALGELIARLSQGKVTLAEAGSTTTEVRCAKVYGGKAEPLAE